MCITGSYRIVHNATLLSLDVPDHTAAHHHRHPTESTWPGRRSSSTAMKTLDFADMSTVVATPRLITHARSQIWDILPQPDTDGEGAIRYAIENRLRESTATLTSPGTPLLSAATRTQDTRWRLILVPPSATAAPTPPTYLIYETDTRSFLGLSPFNDRVVAVASGLSASRGSLHARGENESGEDVLLAWIDSERESFWANWEWLAWKVVAEGWGP